MVMFKVNDELIAEKLSRLTSVECGPCPVLARYAGICLTTKEKARKHLGQGSRKVPVGALFSVSTWPRCG